MADLTKESVVLGINDAKIFPITKDDSTSYTYGAAIDVPGIRSLKVTPTFIEKQLKGDETVIDTYAKLEQIDWSIEHGVISLDALATLIGGKVTAGGTTPNQTQTFSLTKSDLPKYFKLEAKCDYADVGDVHFVLYKCKCTSYDVTLQGEEYATITASGKAIPTIKDGKVKDVVFNEKAKEISAV